MPFSQDFIDKVKKCGVRKIAERYTKLELINENTYMGKCPNPEHNDDTASFMVRLHDNGEESWCCFGCHQGTKDQHDTKNPNFGSDNIAFIQWMFYHKNNHKILPFPQAIERTAMFFGMSIPKNKYSYVYDKNKNRMVFWENNLGPFVREYLYERGLDDSDIAKWHIGYDGNRITIPIFDAIGNVIGFSNRAFSQKALDSGSKYINSAKSEVFQKQKVLYGVNFIDRTKPAIFIVEGQFDAIIASKWGIQNVVASLTCSLSSHHIEYIKENKFTPILCYDNDHAGREGMVKSLSGLLTAGVKNSKLVVLPDGRDIADLGKDVKDKLPQIINARTMSYSQYVLKGIADELDATMMAKQQEIIPRVKQILSSIDDPDEAEVAKEFIKKRLNLWTA